jgi:hypothetical protein
VNELPVLQEGWAYWDLDTPSLEALLQGYIARQANPDRVGCSTIQTLDLILRGQLGRQAAEKVYDHLPHCRECLLELRTLRDIMREELWVYAPSPNPYTAVSLPVEG